MMYCDAHFHIVQCFAAYGEAAGGMLPACGCTCAHSPGEFAEQERLLSRWGAGRTVLAAFGNHPQAPAPEHTAFMERLLREGRICAVGEAGFDFFTPDFRASRSAQEQAWGEALELVAAYRVPLIVHNRKALDLMFRDARQLSRLASVIFHSFAFGPREARALLDHGLNAYFSFGKPLIGGNKRSQACLRELPADRLLLETDSPFQPLQGEPHTVPGDIARVYAAASTLRGVPPEALASSVEAAFRQAFGLEPS